LHGDDVQRLSPRSTGKATTEANDAKNLPPIRPQPRLLTDNSIMSAAPPPSFDRRRTETGLHGADSTGNDVTMA
jgi:hypothetical protein